MKQTRTELPELVDPFTGVVFKARAVNHYEKNDGVPVAPPVDVRRPTVRERVENLLRRGVDPLGHYVGTEGIDMDVPDDPEAPLTHGEQFYVDQVASELAEQAPLPDEGLPRYAPEPPAGEVSSSAASSGAPGSQSEPEGVQSPPQAPSPKKGSKGGATSTN